jgi:hypothetical protein
MTSSGNRLIMAETPELAAVAGFLTAGRRETPPIKPSSQKEAIVVAEAPKTTGKVGITAAHKKPLGALTRSERIVSSSKVKPS